MQKADIGLIGLAVMGENLVMNMESKGFTVAVYNRSVARVKEFVEGRAAGKNIIETHDLEELVASLERPRNPIYRPATSLSTAAIRTSRTRSGGQNMWRAKACATSARVYRGVRKAHCSDPA